jgi:hypothetical protein
MNRRTFIGSLLGAAAGLVLEEAIPFNRVWFFPQKIRLANIGVDWASGSDRTVWYSPEAIETLKSKLDPLIFHRDAFSLEWGGGTKMLNGKFAAGEVVRIAGFDWHPDSRIRLTDSIPS